MMMTMTMAVTAMMVIMITIMTMTKNIAIIMMTMMKVDFFPLAVIVSHKLLWGGKLLRLFQPHILQQT